MLAEHCRAHEGFKPRLGSCDLKPWIYGLEVEFLNVETNELHKLTHMSCERAVPGPDGRCGHAFAVQ